MIDYQSSQGHWDLKFLPYNTACNCVELNQRCAAKSFMLLFHRWGNSDLCNTDVNNNNVINKFIVESFKIFSSICPLKGITVDMAPKPDLLQNRESVVFSLAPFTTAVFQVITRCVQLLGVAVKSVSGKGIYDYDCNIFYKIWKQNYAYKVLLFD